MKYDKVKPDLVIRYLKQYDLPLFGDLEEQVRRLTHYFETEYGKPTIAQCDDCDGLSNAYLDECPFCGNNDPVSDGVDDSDSDEALGVAPTVESETLPAIPDQPSNNLTSEDLDTAVRTIRNCITQAVHNIYTIGRVLKRVKVLDLWKLRTNARGEPIYGSFGEFCEQEVGVTPNRARKLMAISENYTADQISEFGLTRLGVSLSLPKARRGEFLDKAAVLPANNRDLRQLARGMTGMGEPEESDDTSDAPSSTPQPHFEHTMPIDVPLGLHVLDMWRRPTRPGRVGTTTLPARNITDLPWTKLKISDDLILHIRLISDPVGDIKVAVEFRQGLETV
ncbi:MAG: hypothetical protein GY854_02130 [Deltaproteobacteria bacterium]|nr:hypothetical protein [Deltaproteobacteria bacterium]